MKLGFLVLAFSVLCLKANADVSYWSLEKKSGGPASWSCGAKAVLNLNADQVEFSAQGGSPSVRFENINKGPICARSQNGSPFGTLRCIENVGRKNNSELLIQSFSCSTDLPLVKSCNTRVPGSLSASLRILPQHQLTIGSATGWQGQGEAWFECVYR